MMKMKRQCFGENRISATKETVSQRVTRNLNSFIEERDISERSRMYNEELAAILEELPVGARIYTGSKTMFGSGMVIDGKVVSEADTFYEKISNDGRFSTYKKFGKDSDYEEEYSASILKELARGKRLKKLNISIK